MDYKPPRGFKELLPPSAEELSAFEESARRTFRLFGFSEVRIPVVEGLGLFVKSTGESSDIVQKEMFTLHSEQLAGGGERADDAGQERLALRPEGTPGVVRAYLNSGLVKTKPNQRLFYVGSMFRHERPQKGRYREFVQVGAEWLGVGSAASDAEMILMAAAVLRGAKLESSQYRVLLNTLGDDECRPAYRAALAEFFHRSADRLCEDCKRRLTANPMRILDCKTDGKWARENAPRLKPCGPCAAHFESVKGLLKDSGVAFELDPFLVRGLDYYTRTVFEIRVPALGAQDAVAAGGRYDGLVKAMGGPQVPATGWAIGAERSLLAWHELNKDAAAPAPADGLVFVAMEGDDKRGFDLINELRGSGIRVVSSAGEKAMRTQLKDAEFLQARFVVILEGSATRLKDLREKTEQQFGTTELIAYLKTTLTP